MRDHKEFLDAIESGRDLWTNAKVKASLAKRAIGFRFTETTMEQQTDKETGETKMVPVRKVRKYVPPDVSAIKHWQTNRDPEKWRDKKDVDLNQKGPFSINWIMDDGEKK